MREHEVPTHVQAEDKVLLWFTFPQIVAVVAVCAVAYGIYRYLPFGPSEFRLGIAILFGITGIALTVGKVGGRGLPLVAADLLKFNLGARFYVGSPCQLARSEAPPAPEAKPDPLRLLAKKAASGIGKAVKAARRKGCRPLPAPQLVRQTQAQGRGERQRRQGRQAQPPGDPGQEAPASSAGQALVQAPGRGRAAGVDRHRNSRNGPGRRPG